MREREIDTLSKLVTVRIQEDGNVMQQLQASQAQREPTGCAANEADSNGLEEEKQPQVEEEEGQKSQSESFFFFLF